MGRFKLKSIGFGILMLELLVAVALSAVISSLPEYFPQLFAMLGLSGVVVVNQNIVLFVASLLCLTLGFVLLQGCVLERLIKISITRAALLGLTPWLVFLCIFWLLPPSDGFQFIVMILFALTALCSIVLVYVSLQPAGVVFEFRNYGLLIGISALLLGGFFPLLELYNSARLAASFPAKSNFETRREWTNNFLVMYPAVEKAIEIKIRSDQSQPELNSKSLAFANDRIHTIVIDGMSWPQISASLELRNGNLLDICRGVKSECLLASGKESVS